MKILFIFPRIEHGVATVFDIKSVSSLLFGYPIITLPYMAAITPEKYDIRIINENFEELKLEEELEGVDLVAITCYTMTAPRVYQLADRARELGKTVILGGYHPTALPEEALQHCDCVVKGLAENSWPQALSDFEAGKLQRIYERDLNFTAEDIPAIRRDLIKRQNPFLGALQTTRGCCNSCEFCAIRSFCGQSLVLQRPIKEVVKEMKQIPNPMFIIHDPHLTANRKYARALFKEMIEQKVNKYWVANGTTNVLAQADDEFMNLARKAGCVEWFVGFESVNQESLNGIHKTHNKVADFQKLIKRAHDYGMTMQGGIIFGLDGDTPDIFDLTLEKMYEYELDTVEINILTPYPGTPLYDRLEKAGRIISRDWSRYNQTDIVFQPKNMSVEELRVGTQRVAKEFYSIPNIIGRGIKAFWTTKNFGGILPAATNYSFRRYYRRDYDF